MDPLWGSSWAGSGDGGMGTGGAGSDLTRWKSDLDVKITRSKKGSRSDESTIMTDGLSPMSFD